ncbi:hypothetical protein [Coleofasciculus chthonoplastes]|uniref:hypothetical protein n=1 Tax=Coleofasciculus chthonoplastes TaxID=64178 RepID=UPI0032FC6581
MVFGKVFGFIVAYGSLAIASPTASAVKECTLSTTVRLDAGYDTTCDTIAGWAN